MEVIKRDGRVVEFEKSKISDAILKAMCKAQPINRDLANRIANEISKMEKTQLSVEDIQDLVEEKLMNSKRKDVAKEYVIYRNDRSKIREQKTQLMKDISEKLMATNVQNQNANVDEKSFGGRVGEASDSVLKKYALDNCMSEMAKNNHINNEIYIHDLNSYAVGMHNCASRETKFLTDKGVVSFYDFQDGEKVRVLTHTGEIKEAQVQKHGIQKLNKITFSRAGQCFATERFTPNHRWLLQDGSVTTNLKVGDKIYKAPVEIRNFDFENATEKEKYYWCLGFVLADGTEAYRWSHGKRQEDITFVRLRLCGEKIRFANRFKVLKHSAKEMDNGDLYLTFSSTINFHKKFPELDDLTWNEKLALFDGLYCGDGQQSGSRKSILVTDEQIASFIEDVVPSLGYFITNIKDKTGEKTNYGIRKFTKEYSFIGDSNKYFWTVVDIKEDSEEEVWCLNVKDNHSFVLPNGIVTGNCLSIPFDKLLKNGFNTRQADIRPAQSINTAFQLVAVISQLQSLQQFGGVSATHLDWTMVPYVRKSFTKHLKDGMKYIEGLSEYKINRFEKWVKVAKNGVISFEDEEFKEHHPETWNYAMDMTIKETYQAVEGMYHNLNTLQSRSGNQLPFTSINYGTCTLPEGRLIIEALLNSSIKGIGKLHKTSIFPCGIFQCMKGVNQEKGDPNYDLFQLALKSTAQRLYPNYANVDWSGNTGYDRNDPKTYFSTMGCRTANGWDINGFGQLKDGRGNICPVTIIMPTLAMEVKNHLEGLFEPDGINNQTIIDAFMKLLDRKIDEAKDMLLERFDWICSQNPDSAKFMYENGTMEGYIPEEGIRSALKHGTLALGQLGLAETLQILIGTDHTTKDGMELAKKIEQLFKDKCNKFKEEYHLNFGVYYTPAENLCYTSMQKFKEKYGEIKNISDKEFFTNSIHVPVWKKISPFKKIDIESQLTGFSSAGCITYVELESTCKNNLEALEQIVKYAMRKDIPYFAVNVPNDTCLDCGYCDEFDVCCPMCHSTNIQQLRRVTGYLTGDYKTAFNKGKQQEVEMRVKHE